MKTHWLALARPLLVLSALAMPALVAPPALAIDATAGQAAGRWLTEPRDGIMEVTVAPDGRLEGRIIGGNSPGKVDAKNPDPAKRGVVLRGQVILKDMAYEGNGHWGGGSIYDPNSGSTYKCNVELRADGTLKVRGYIGFSLLGKSQAWTRYTGTSLDLPPAK